MIPSIPFEHVVMALGVSLIVFAVVLLIAELKHGKQIKKLAFPVYEYSLKSGQKKAQKIVEDATKQAREILVAAELASIRGTAEKKIETKNLEETFRQNIETLGKETQQLFQKYARESEQVYGELVEALKKQTAQTGGVIEGKMGEVVQDIGVSLQNIAAHAKEAEEKFSTLAARIEESAHEGIRQNEEKFALLASRLEGSLEEGIKQNLEQIRGETGKVMGDITGVLSQMKDENIKKIEEHLTREFENAQEEIRAYRGARMHIVDTQLVELVGRTTEIVLQKGVSVSETADLAYRALEEAKKEGIFSR